MTTKENRIFYTKANMTTDDNIIFDEISNTKEFEFFESLSSDHYKPEDPNLNAIKFFIQFTNSFRKLHSSYLKLQQLAAVVEGVIIIGYEIVNIVYLTFSHNHLELFMCNKLLDIYEEVEEESNIKNKLICNILH